MLPMTLVAAMPTPIDQPRSAHVLLNTVLIGLIAFLTVVDLFATQAILPALTHAYGTSPAVMSFAVNASTIGMAVAGLAMAVIGRRIDRRIGILLSAAAALDTHIAAVHHAQHPGLHRPADPAGSVHGNGFHADACLCRRDKQFERSGLRRCRLHNGQCRKQSVRPAAVRRRRGSFRPGVEFRGVRRTEPVRCAAGVRGASA